jgi:tripartite-type tricarboxylate transporter receptor subunit TctC
MQYRLLRPAAAALTVLLCGVEAAGAQAYPSRPVRVVLPAAAGGALDVLSRIVAPKVSESWGQPLIVENRAGAGGNIAFDLVSKAAPDGHTHLFVSQSFAVNLHLKPAIPYDPVRDFASVMLVGTTDGVLLVPPSLPVKTVNDLIAMAKAQPGRISYSSTGNGTSGHMNMSLFINLTGIDIVHVPYKDVGLAQNDLMAGRVQAYIAPMPAFLQFIRSGRMRALGVTSGRRNPALPDVPTIAEAGVPGYESVTWYGWYTQAKTPKNRIQRMNRELARALQDPEVKQRYAALSVDIVASTPEHHSGYLREEVAKWGKVVAAMKVRSE